MSRLFLFTYQLIPSRPNDGLIKELQNSDEWWHYLDFTWIISTNESADEFYSRIAPHLSKADRELIVEFKRGAQYQGWLQKEAWDWIQQRLEPTIPTYPYPHRYGR